MCHIRYTLGPRVGDSHNLRGTMIDQFVYVEQKKKVDVLNFMFVEIWKCVMAQKSCIYAPFFQALIEFLFVLMWSLLHTVPVCPSPIKDSSLLCS